LCLHFVVVADCAREVIHSRIGNGNGESFLGIKNLPICVVAGIETILRDCDIPVGPGPNIPFWIAKAFGLKVMSLVNGN
jgi:hypothetical protein